MSFSLLASIWPLASAGQAALVTLLSTPKRLTSKPLGHRHSQAALADFWNNDNQTTMKAMCDYCLFQSACFIQYKGNDDTDAANALYKKCPDTNILIEKFAKLPTEPTACSESIAAVRAKITGKCIIAGDAVGSKATLEVVLLGMLPLTLLMVTRLLDMVGFRNYVEKLYWSLCFTLLGVASNFSIEKYYDAFSGKHHPHKESLVRWPCSEFGWAGPFAAVFSLMERINWGLVGAVLLCWLFTSVTRCSNRFTPVRIIELRDGRCAVNPFIVLMYIVTMVVTLSTDLYHSCRYLWKVVASQSSGCCKTANMPRRNREAVEIMGFNDLSAINAHVKKAFDDSVEELNKAALELLGSNILIVCLIFFIDHFACPGKNAARNALLGGVIVNALNSSWRTYVLIIRQLDTHSVFSRRRRLFVVDGDDACEQEGVRSGYSVSVGRDARVSNKLFHGGLLAWLFRCNERALQDEDIHPLRDIQSRDMPEQQRVSSVRLACTLRNAFGEAHRAVCETSSSHQGNGRTNVEVNGRAETASAPSTNGIQIV